MYVKAQKKALEDRKLIPKMDLEDESVLVRKTRDHRHPLKQRTYLKRRHLEFDDKTGR
jgi:hypothetical protein